MPIANLRIIVKGVPEGNGQFSAAMIDKRQLQALAKKLADATGRAKFEITEQIRDIVEKAGRV